MSGDDDDILDINLDEDEDESASEEVLDIELGPRCGSGSGVPAQPKSGPPSRAQADGNADVPMIAGGVCPRCGFALRPLEEQCPRCAKLGVPDAPGVIGQSEPESRPLPGLNRPVPDDRQGRGCLVGGIIGGLALLAIAVGVPVAIWMQPAQRAKREYELGLQAQLRAQFDMARQHYQKALELDPDMGLAAFSMGTTYLHVGDPALVQVMQEMVERAVQGHTQELDQADGWFRRALQIGQVLPPGRRLMDQRIRTPAQLRAFARASLALTAYIRAAAAMQAEQFEQALAWIEVAQREAQAAMADDPGNNPAQQVLRSVEPLIPPPPNMP